MKDNFLLKKSFIETFTMLDDTNAGKLAKGIFNYVNTGSSNLEGLLEVIFLPIKQFIDSNEEKYKKRCNANAKNGLLGGRPKDDIDEEIKPNKTQNNPLGYFDENTHISYINNHEKEKLLIGCGEEEEKREPLKAEEASLLEETEKKKILSKATQNTLKTLREKTISNKIYGPTIEDNGLLEEIVDKLRLEVGDIEIDKSSLNAIVKNIMRELAVDKVLMYLNEVTGSSYKLETTSHRTKILSQIEKGHKINDFYKIIDVKSKQWLKTDMAQYLRPSTLFGPKMDEYLAQPAAVIAPQNQPNQNQESIPNWFGKNIATNEASVKEQQEINDLLASLEPASEKSINNS